MVPDLDARLTPGPHISLPYSTGGPSGHTLTMVPAGGRMCNYGTNLTGLLELAGPARHP